MAEQEVKLLGATGSPFSSRIQIALKLKGVPYEYVDEEDLYGIKSPLLLEFNPVHKKIPVLLHAGKAIAESLVILEYIDETWKGNHILPEDPYQRATARFWAQFVDEKCKPAVGKACWGKGEDQEKAVEEAIELLKALEGQLGDRKFFGGDSIGLVDITANLIAYWYVIFQEVARLEILTKDNLPRLCEWANEFRACDAVKENLPPRDRIFSLLKARHAAQNETLRSI